METRKVETKVAVLVLAVAALLVFSLFAVAGNFGPPEPRSPMMTALDQIHDTITSHLSERQGYCRAFVLSADSNQVIFTVPEGKCFVLLSLLRGAWGVGCPWPEPCEPPLNWNLTVDDDLFINDSASFLVTENERVTLNFPDRCAVVNAGETLRATGNNGLSLTIVGYFYDVQ